MTIAFSLMRYILRKIGLAYFWDSPYKVANHVVSVLQFGQLLYTTCLVFPLIWPIIAYLYHCVHEDVHANPFFKLRDK